jgi:lysozyme family protein
MRRLLLSILLIVSTACHSADCHRIVPFILKWEGGWVNNIHDAGGETNKGIAYKTWKHYYGAACHDSFMIMPVAKWEHIYKDGYWDVVHGDQIKSQKIAEVLAEWCWGSGSAIPIKAVQRQLHIQVDGVFGVGTLRAINAAQEKALYEALVTDRFKFLAHLPQYASSNWIFTDGWYNRMTDFVFFQNTGS